jgi:hypothetical protein
MAAARTQSDLLWRFGWHGQSLGRSVAPAPCRSRRRFAQVRSPPRCRSDAANVSIHLYATAFAIGPGFWPSACNASTPVTEHRRIRVVKRLQVIRVAKWCRARRVAGFPARGRPSGRDERHPRAPLLSRGRSRGKAVEMDGAVSPRAPSADENHRVSLSLPGVRRRGHAVPPPCPSSGGGIGPAARTLERGSSAPAPRGTPGGRSLVSPPMPPHHRTPPFA